MARAVYWKARRDHRAAPYPLHSSVRSLMTAPRPPSSRPIRRAVFASDFHLWAGDPRGVERAAAFVARAVADGCDAVFLLGDVFRGWLGAPSLRDPGLAPFLDELRAATSAGVRVVLVHGNYDFLMGRSIEEALGVEMVGLSTAVALGGQRVRLSHGDEYCTLDVSYHKLHRILRSRPFRALVNVLPTATRQRMANFVESGSKERSEVKLPTIKDHVDDAIIAQFAAGHDAAICGHVHTARDEWLGVDEARGRLIVLGDFETTGSHAVWSDRQLVLHRVDPLWVDGRPLVIAIDGPAGSGKSSTAQRLAERLHFARLDSGALYRTVAARALRAGVDTTDGEALGALTRAIRWEVHVDGGVSADGERMTDAEIRGPAVAALVSPVSAHPAVRAALLDVQRDAAQGHPGLVSEGRDMASVVFPDADLSIYLDARPEVRATRRLAQNPGEGASVDEVRAAIETRDRRDSERSVAPLQRTDGATLVDTSDLSPEEVDERLEALVVSVIRRRAARRLSEGRLRPSEPEIVAGSGLAS